MSVHFDSNCLPSPPATPSSELEPALLHACLLSEENEPPKPEWLARNPAHLILSTKATNSTTGLHVKRIQALAPNSPTVLITALSGEPLLCSTVWIVSSARTVELYPSGEYAGTFRGETLDEGGFTLTGPPLFAIKIDQENIPRSCNELFVKFFVPKKPADFQDSLDLHWLIVLAGVAQGSSKLSVSDGTDAQAILDAMLVPKSAGSGSRSPPSGLPSATLSFVSPLLSPNVLSGSAPMLDMAALVSAFSSSVDMEKVRGMLSDIQIEGLSQRAKDHMGAMETQAKLHQERASSSFLTAVPKAAVAPETSFVTKAELAQTEERILSRIDTSLSNLENRIMARIEEGLLTMEERLLSKLMSHKGTD